MLVFPAIWTQRAIKQRVLGDVAWKKLTKRRQVFEAAGLHNIFVSSEDITTASKNTITAKLNSLRESRNAGSDSSTPRKVYPILYVKILRNFNPVLNGNHL